MELTEINWNQHHSKVSTERQNQYLDYLVDPRFQGVNWLFVLLFENNDNRKARSGYFLRRVETKRCNVIIDGQNFLRLYNSIQKIKICQWDKCTTGGSQGYPYFKKHYKLIAIDLSKKQAVDVDPKAI